MAYAIYARCPDIQYMVWYMTTHSFLCVCVCACVANILLAFHLHFTSASLAPCAANLSSGNLRIFLSSFFAYNYVNLFIMLNLCEHVAGAALLERCNKTHSYVSIIMISRQSSKKHQQCQRRKSQSNFVFRASKSNQCWKTTSRERQRANAAATD